MSDVKKFNQAQEEVKELTKRPSNDELFGLYGLFKQASEGDVSTPRPGMIKVKERAKWDAWKKLEGMQSESAMEEYTGLVERLKNQYGVNS